MCSDRSFLALLAGERDAGGGVSLTMSEPEIMAQVFTFILAGGWGQQGHNHSLLPALVYCSFQHKHTGELQHFCLCTQQLQLLPSRLRNVTRY